jgi:hypothetical protein
MSSARDSRPRFRDARSSHNRSSDYWICGRYRGAAKDHSEARNDFPDMKIPCILGGLLRAQESRKDPQKPAHFKTKSNVHVILNIT